LITTGTNGNLLNLLLDAGGAGTSPAFIIKNVGTELMRISSSGNVGIGTSTPSYPLDVVGSMRIQYAGSDLFATIIGPANRNLRIDIDANDDADSFVVRDLRDGSEHFTVQAGGNVGIGTTSPKTRLQSSSGGTLNAPSLGSSSTNAPLYLTNNDTAYGLVVGNSSADGHVWLQAQRTDGTATAYNITLNEAGGNVGIGTTSPTGFAGYTSLDINNATSGALIDLSQGDAMKGRLIATSSTMAIETASGVPIIFQPAGTERMRIDSSGLVGIGETSPVAHLSVNAGGSPDATYGIANFAASAGNNSYVTVSRGANDQGGIKILRGSVADLSIHVNAAESSIINYNGGDTNDGLFFRSGSAETDVMALSSSGYVGIGTTSPSRLLTLSNTGATLLSLVSTNDDNCQLLFGDSASDTVGKIVYRHSDDSMAFEVNVAEAMRLDSSGNLLVGKTSTAFGTAGVEASAGSGLWSTRSGLPPLALNRLSTDGSIADFYKDGAIVGSIKCRSSGGNLEIDTVQSGIDFAGDGWLPMRNGSIVDNDLDIGSSSFRFDDIYATNGTIQTSDVNEKQDIEALSEAETRVAVAAKGLLRKFRWKSAVEEKGDDARVHFGVIAQDLQAAFVAEGLDAGRYGMFIHSTWTDEETGEERSRMGVRYSELLAFIIAAI